MTVFLSRDFSGLRPDLLGALVDGGLQRLCLVLKNRGLAARLLRSCACYPAPGDIGQKHEEKT